jgi:SAM-dependent methyltransferase
MVLDFILRVVRRFRDESRRARRLKRQRELAKLSTKEIFTRIYQERSWGRARNSSQRFYSGSGSSDPSLVEPYVAAVRQALVEFPSQPSVVDLGCGDFQVGAQIRRLCSGYVACDIVEPLIEHHRKHYQHLNTEFRVLDITRDELPAADVVFIRQVLQHLSNAEITAAVQKIAKTYRYLILTEHLPKGSYVPNLDKPTGRDIRLQYDSGIDLTLPPFSLPVSEAKSICEVPKMGGIIRTTFYTLAGSEFVAAT